MITELNAQSKDIGLKINKSKAKIMTNTQNEVRITLAFSFSSGGY